MTARFLRELGLTLTSERGVNDLSGAWKSDPYWLIWGTKFDGTDLVYYLPEVYENSIKVMVKKFQGQIKIHIRHYYKTKDEDRWYPTKRGVALSLKKWGKFNKEFAAIDSEVRRLRCQNLKKCASTSNRS